MTAFLEALAPFVSASLRYVPMLVLFGLALSFGRTLRPGAVPMIERVARQGMPGLSAALCRYTRRLTAMWCVYFVVAATLTAAAELGFERASFGVATASAVLFVGEHWLRQRIFPHDVFPGLLQQVRDTVRVWRPRSDA